MGKKMWGEISEGVCQLCDRDYCVWFAPSPLWNKVMRYSEDGETREKYAFVCMDCFANEAEEAGIKPTAWVLDHEVVS